SRSAVPHPALDKSVSVDQLDSVLSETDVLVSTLPLTSATQGLIDSRRLALLGAGAGIIIVGRAKVFDCEALADALDAGRLSGAVMDVFPVEPLPPSHRLWSTRSLLMTPHCSVDDHVGYVDRCIAIFADNLTRMAKGEPLRNAVNPALGY
ncbi:D-2-hydroxyacid dehydrogenase, partial [Mesorhizobium sp. M7D.F.Ca.US.004.03.1.1]|uniref:NAD(P)-dependent oxidoreductase n=1 Tax=Mesorhizobium sp. M7D.F.Ca.US.004.03.1.1 TaxID=2496702 RepID=UPI000FD39F7F